MADGSPLALLGMSAERRSAADALKSRIGLCLVQQLVQQTKMAAREPPSSLCNHLGIGYLMWYSRQESNLRLLPPEGSTLVTGQARIGLSLFVKTAIISRSQHTFVFAGAFPPICHTFSLGLSKILNNSQKNCK